MPHLTNGINTNPVIDICDTNIDYKMGGIFKTNTNQILQK